VYFVRPCKRWIFPNFVLFQNSKLDLFRIMYSAFSVLRQNQILWITRHMTKLTKMTKNGSKNPVFGSKIGSFQNSEYTEYSELIFFRSPFSVYYVLCQNWIYFSRSNSNFNQKFNYEFRTQGLSILYLDCYLAL